MDTCIGTIDMGIGMRIDMCIGMHIEVHIHMSIYMCMGIWIDMCVLIPAAPSNKLWLPAFETMMSHRHVCRDVCRDVCSHMCRHVCRHVYRPDMSCGCQCLRR